MKQSSSVLQALGHLLVICLVASVSSVTAAWADDQRPSLALDLQESSVPDVSQLTPVYTGSGTVIYAFLVATAPVQTNITAIAVRLRLIDAENVALQAFTFLSPWSAADTISSGFDPSPLPSTANTPCAVGYWTMQLFAGSGSRAKLVLEAPGGINGDAAVVADSNLRALEVANLGSGAVNDTPRAGGQQASASGYRDFNSHNLIIRTKASAFQMPKGLHGFPATLPGDMDVRLKAVVDLFGPVYLDRLSPHRQEADSIITYYPEELTSRRPDLFRVFVLSMPDTSALPALAESLNANPAVAYAAPNLTYEPAIEPNDEYVRPEQWYLYNYGQYQGAVPGADISAFPAWDIGRGSANVILCLIDSGIWRGHPDLQGRQIIGDDTYDGDHGTNTAGVVGAVTNNGTGIAAVDWNATIMSQRWGNLGTDDVVGAIEAAVEGGADIINMSFSRRLNGWLPEEPLREYCLDAVLQGAVLFGSTGNEGETEPYYPAAYWRMVSGVGGTTWSDARWSDSNHGPWMDLVAPADYIYTLDLAPGYYELVAGTSFSAPIVSGVASLLLGRNSGLRDRDIPEILQRTADDLGAQGFDDDFGWGRVNAEAALEYVRDNGFIHAGISNMTVRSVTDWYDELWIPGHNGVTDHYLVKRYEMEGRHDFVHPCWTTDSWTRIGGTNGYEPEAPHYHDVPGGVIVDVDEYGVTGRTYVYEVRSYPNGSPLGWWPCPPECASLAVTLVGACGDSGVTAVGGSVENSQPPSRLVVLGNPSLERGIDLRVDHATADRLMVQIYDVAGRTVRRLAVAGMARGAHVHWDAKDDQGNRCAPGVYFAQLAAAGKRIGGKSIVVAR